MLADMSIQEYKNNVKPCSRKDSLGQLIAARDENGVGLSHMEVVSQSFVFMVAGNRSIEATNKQAETQVLRH